VQVVLDPAPIGIGGEDEPLAGGAQIGYLEPQSVERRLQRFVEPSLQGDRPPPMCLPKLSVKEPPASSGLAPHATGCQPPTHPPVGSVVAADPAF
jgi:hypothetical protein